MLATPSSLSTSASSTATAAAAAALAVIVTGLLLVASKGRGLDWVIAPSFIVEFVDKRVECKVTI